MKTRPHTVRHLLIRAILLLTTVFALTQLSFASTFDTSHEISVNIPAEHLIKGQNNGGTFVFELRGVDEAPMPEGAVNGIKTVAVRDQGRIDFGNIVYDHPGVYDYIVERPRTKYRNIVADETVYHVSVVVLNTGEISIIVRDEDGKTGLVFEDQGIEPTSSGKAVNTGDLGFIDMWLTAAVISLILIGVISADLRRRREVK